MEITLAEVLFFVLLVVGVYYALTPVRRRLERWLLSLMGRDSGRKGQGPVYKIKRED